MKIKRLELQNICGYRKATFKFHPHLNMLFGPNGSGKSNLLNIISIMSSPRRFAGRDFSMHFRKMIMHEDYDPVSLTKWDSFVGTMNATAIFEVDGADRKVVLEVDPSKVKALEEASANVEASDTYNELVEQIGIIENELPEEQIDYAFYVDADNPSNMSKFQLNSESADTFLDIADAVFGYECYLDKEVRLDGTGKTSTGRRFAHLIGEKVKSEKIEASLYTDFVLVKKDDGEQYPPVKVHYRRMSDGERKISTLFKQMCTPSQYNTFDMFLIDNLELHVYANRHKAMIDKIQQHFEEKQIIATTHSPILVGMDSIKPYLPAENRLDVLEIRKRG